MNEKSTCPLLDGDREAKRILLQRILSQDTSWREKEGQSFPMGAALPALMEPGQTYERRTPVNAATVSSQFVVPSLRSIGCGIAGGILVAAIGGLEAGFVGGALVGSVAYFVNLAFSERSLWTIERLVGRDLTGDDVIGEPRRTVRVESVEKTKAGGRIKYADIPASEEQLEALARALFIQRQPFSRRALAGTGKPFSEGEFKKLQKAMRDAELVWPIGDGENAGFKLNSAGRQFLTQFLQKGRW